MNLKETIVQYVGELKDPENGEVTPEMIAGVLTDEFPDMMLLVAQENYLRGYTQALDDVEAMEAERLKEQAKPKAEEADSGTA